MTEPTKPKSQGSTICPFCSSQYDETTHLPRVLVDCGHTICTQCLTNVLTQNTLKCPFDDIPFSKARFIFDFKVNFSLKQLIEEKANMEICPLHNEPMRLMCCT